MCVTTGIITHVTDEWRKKRRLLSSCGKVGLRGRNGVPTYFINESPQSLKEIS
jgi:hypothetical protein